MERLQAKSALALSPLFTASGTGFIMLLGLSFLTFVGPRPSIYAWYALLVFFLAGIVLQFRSKRVLFYRVYDTVGWGLASLVFALLTWSVTVMAWGNTGQLLAGIVIPAMLLVFCALVFMNYQHNPQRKRMPYGDIGRMNPNTGIIVDPSYVEASPDTSQKSTAGLHTIARLSPLIAGMTMLLVRALPDATAVLIFVPVGVVLSSITAFIAARYFSFMVSTAHWEKTHGKPIIVKR